MSKEITDQIEYVIADEGELLITRCICGKEFDVYQFMPHPRVPDGIEEVEECPNCHRKVYYLVHYQVFEYQKEI